MLIHGSTLCRQLKSCLRDWSISRMKPRRHDNDKVQRNRRWQRPDNESSSYPQEAVHRPSQLESSTRALLESRSRSRVSHRNGQPDNSRLRHSRVRRIELQSLSTQLLLHVGDDAQRPSSGNCSELSRRSCCRSVAQVALGVLTWRLYQVRSNVAIAVEETVR